MSVFNPEVDTSTVNPFAQCPNCQRLVKLEVKNDEAIISEIKCSFCRTDITESEVSVSYSLINLLTRAIQSATDVLKLDVALPLVLGLMFIEIIIAYSVRDMFPTFSNFMFSVSMLIFLGGYNLSKKWLDKYGELRLKDEEFVLVKKQIKLSKSVWIAAMIFNILLWAFCLKFILN